MVVCGNNYLNYVLHLMSSSGENPYENLNIRDLPDSLKNNVRLQKPERCGDVYAHRRHSFYIYF
ncbi:hypothetical protein DPMN_059483 [Dreissena polymorpha]|uniref:Uncharacterized protein n=1 Tax=Dreissena polymorpha TaxID=45954 RepID=A0A9D4C428_DREPO|nr:hypothetical protein DPMN_059483 [Dreissena polymorpha]